MYLYYNMNIQIAFSLWIMLPDHHIMCVGYKSKSMLFVIRSERIFKNEFK